MARHKKQDTRGRRGDGTVFPIRRNGEIVRYGCDVELPKTPGGSRKRIRVYGRTEEEAHAKRRALLASRDAGTAQGPDATTLETYARWWLETVKRNTVSPQTYQNYEALFVNHVYPALGPLRLRRVSTERLQTFLARLTPGIVEHVAILLGQMFRYATTARPRRLTDNPMDGVQVPRHAARGGHPLTEAELVQFVEAIAGHALEGAFWLSVSGLRAGEVCGAQWQDINWDAATIRVTRQAQHVKGRGLTLADTLKSEKSRRVVHLAPPILAGLRRAYTRAAAAQLAGGPRAVQVATAPRAKLLSPSTLWRTFKKILAGLGLPSAITLHDLRKTYATLAARMGAAPRDVQQQLGHATLAVTLGVYTQPTEDGQRAAAERFGKVIGG